MLDQLYFTWSDKGLGGITGFRVRAASEGVSDINGERYISFKPYLNYALPQGTDAYTASTEKSPYSLIFADTGKERVLAQQVYVGKDGYNRPGVYFVHLIAGLSEQSIACDAIDLWRSSLWETTDVRVPNSVDLDSVAPVVLQQKKGSLSEHAIANVQQYLPFLIQAYLTLGDTQKIYIAAPNEQVAALIWGLAHSLPRTLQASLTFSTYEFDVLKAPERIIGTSRPESNILKGYVQPTQILPTECYSGKGIAIDCYSGKVSDLKNVSQEIVDYSLFATNCFVNRRKKELDTVLNVAEGLEVQNTGAFLVVCKFYASIALGKTLTQQEVTGLLGNAKLAIALLPQEKVQRAIIDLAVTDLTWWNEQAASALKKLRSPFEDKEGKQAKDALAQFGMQVARDLGTALLSYQTASYTVLMRVLYEVTPPEIDIRPWVQLLESLWAQSARDKSFHPAKALNWEFRAWFLEQWAFGSQEIKEEHLRPWLQMNWSDFNNFLTLSNIPIRWRQLAIIELLTASQEPISKDTITTIIKNEQYLTIFVNALRELMISPPTLEAALRGFSKLVERGYPHKIWLLATLLSVRELSAQELDAFLQAARLDPKEKITALEEHCQLLLPPKSKTPASSLVVDLLKVYLNKFSLDKLTKDPSPHTFAALEYLHSQSKRLPKELATQVQDWTFVSRGIMREPFIPLELEAKSLKLMSEAIAYLELQNNKKYRESLFLVLINSIQNNDDLRCVYESFTPILAGSRKELLYELSAFIGERYTPRMAHTYLMPYIAEALAYSLDMQSLSAKEKFLKPLLEVLLQNADEVTFKKIEGEINVWPKAYRKEWVQYAPAPQKKAIWQRVGDVGNLIGGMRIGGSSPGGKLAGGNNGTPSGRLPHPHTAPPQNQPPQQQVQQRPEESPRQPVPQQYHNNPPPPQGRRDAPHMDANPPNIQYLQHPQKEPYTPPNNVQQQGGYQAPRPPNQNPPPQEFTSAGPYALNNAPTSASQPQSTVNGKPIYPNQIRAVFNLRGPYIEHRRSELNEIFKEYSKAKKDTTWIPKERDELDYHSQMWHTLEALECDVLIQEALGHFGINPAKLLDEVYTKVKNQYKKAFGNQYSEAEIKNVLLIFVRYRLLEEYLRNQTSMKDWLEKRRSNAAINRSPMPLPDIK